MQKLRRLIGIIAGLIGLVLAVYVSNNLTLRAADNGQCPPTRINIDGLDNVIVGVLSVAFSPDGKTVLVGSWDHTASLWDTQTGVLLHCLLGHVHSVYVVAYSPDGKTVLTGSADTTAKLWDAHTGMLLRTLQASTGPYQIPVSKVSYSPDGKTILTLSNVAMLWDPQKGTLLHRLQSYTPPPLELNPPSSPHANTV